MHSQHPTENPEEPTNTEDDGTIPISEKPWWTDYNSFRAAQTALPDGTAAPDLVVMTPESCVTTCDDTENISIWIQLGNRGAAPLSSGAKVKLLFMGEMQTEATMSFDDLVLAPGEFGAAILLENLNIAGVTKIEIVAIPNEAECKVDDSNTLALEPPFCTPPG